jgi:predicted transposase YdaD
LYNHHLAVKRRWNRGGTERKIKERMKMTVRGRESGRSNQRSRERRKLAAKILHVTFSYTIDLDDVSLETKSIVAW